MAAARKIVEGTLGSAGRAAQLVEQGAAAVLGVRVARALYGRWRRLSAAERVRMEELAEDVRGRALDLRGAADRVAAGRDLLQANTRLAEAMVESAAADPEVSEGQVSELREDLARELRRLEGVEVTVTRAAQRPPTAPPPGERL